MNEVTGLSPIASGGPPLEPLTLDAADGVFVAACPYLEPTEDAVEETPWVPYTAVLTATPYRVAIGDQVDVTGSRFTPGARVDLVWYSAEGHYELEGRTELLGQRYELVTTVVASAVADAAGEIRASFVISPDFGGPHDIRARVAGQEVAQTGVMVTPTWSMNTTAGPVGTVIELHATGIEYRTSLNTWHVLWDNRYLGLLTAVTTKGTATARFRAAGPSGRHYISVWNNSFRSSPYLAFDRSPFREEIDVPAEFTFTVTADEGSGPVLMDDFSALDNPWPVEEIGPARLQLSIDRAVVGHPVTLSGSALPANASLDLIWRTAAGDRVNVGGIGQIRRTMAHVRTGSDGRFSFDFDTPPDLGGNHRIEVRSGDEVLAATSFVILPCVVSFTPRVRIGDKIAVHLKGTGWTTCDNTYSVVYDNSFIGYACAFSTQGDMQFTVTATGSPGTHLLDLYPNIYKGADLMPDVYAKPQLTYADDHPDRKTPAIRFSIEVIE